MALTIEILDLGSTTVDSSYLVQYRQPGVPATMRIVGYLIQGGSEGPMLVDTGYRGPDSPDGSKVVTPQGAGLEAELGRHGLKPADIRYILHTHLHLDHCGKDDIFPASTTVVVNRRELEVACSGVNLSEYAAIDLKHMLDRVHTPGSAWILDLSGSNQVELVPGVFAEWAGGHTEGSMNILVETGEGTACICGDLIYHVQDQLVAPSAQLNYREPKISGATTMSQLQEKTAIKKALSSCTYLLPMHDAPATVSKGGVVVGRITGKQVPGPVTSLEAYRSN